MKLRDIMKQHLLNMDEAQLREVLTKVQHERVRGAKKAPKELTLEQRILVRAKESGKSATEVLMELLKEAEVET